mmetsp:Transcript_6273/g.9243  ORF Transcript_6273/g.9243 Transcript_6273/m.9243 type:complete len:113 (-) Transcript_6273:19-357(-)
MDAKILPVLDGDNDPFREQHETELRVRFKFTSYKNGCAGFRGHGQQTDEEGLNIKIDIPRSVVQAASSGDREFGVDVVAGWAGGREPVVLTKPVVFLLKCGDGNNTNRYDEL